MGLYKDLIAFQKSYQLSMEIYLITRSFPSEEQFGITSQIRRSSRSVCANLAEAYRRRCSIRHFKSKLSDAEAENIETEIWIEFSKDCKFLSKASYLRLINLNDEVGKLIYYMIHNPEKFL